ncbi:hypothetical protein [Kitasatospora sp. NPDC097643]|uniref:hypothetical protein n=1 Tax=Kitasatospora sp. NPDC097643 TaxID=3157230 RepID=UPI00332ED88A
MTSPQGPAGPGWSSGPRPPSRPHRVQWSAGVLALITALVGGLVAALIAVFGSIGGPFAGGEEPQPTATEQETYGGGISPGPTHTASPTGEASPPRATPSPQAPTPQPTTAASIPLAVAGGPPVTIVVSLAQPAAGKSDKTAATSWVSAFGVAVTPIIVAGVTFALGRRAGRSSSESPPPEPEPAEPRR